MNSVGYQSNYKYSPFSLTTIYNQGPGNWIRSAQCEKTGNCVHNTLY